VVFEAGADDARATYTRECFRDYQMIHDPSGRYAAMYRSHHLVGMEVGISIAAAALRKEATGAPDAFRSDVVATAKKPLKAGETLDGEGGYAVYGKLTRAEDSLARRALPLGLAHGIKLVRSVGAGDAVSWDDVAIEESDVVRLRREMERAFAPKGAHRVAAE
jgi:predicted homoserine dehydrogenase-like protein